MTLTPETMTKNERSILVYSESRMVDGGGILEGIRMNEDDHADLAKLAAAGYLDWGRIPAKFLHTGPTQRETHWVKLTESGWALAHACRRFRARPGPWAAAVLAEVDERNREAA